MGTGKQAYPLFNDMYLIINRCGMEGNHFLRGLAKGFWIFAIVLIIIMLITNIATQFLLYGAIDFQRALTLSVGMGIVLALIISIRRRRRRH